ncbi:MAG: zinc ribbon domain-containing protein [Candidatus Aenigmatarchaeota archaeon]
MLGKKEKRCKNCGEKVDKNWSYCPFCGYNLSFESRFDYFGKSLREIEEEFEKLFEFELPRFEIKPLGPGFHGIRITFSSRSGEEPKIEVKTYGKYKEYEPEIKKRLGIKVPIEEVEEEKEREVKVTEEAPFRVITEGKKKIIEMDLPGVKSINDIKIKKLSQSIEVRAYTKDKAYFSLIPIEGGEHIVDKELKNEKLKIYLE